MLGPAGPEWNLSPAAGPALGIMSNPDRLVTLPEPAPSFVGPAGTSSDEPMLGNHWRSGPPETRPSWMAHRRHTRRTRPGLSGRGTL